MPATRRTASSRVSGEVLVLGHVQRDPQGGLRAPLPDAALEHPQLAVLDRELDVAEVPVVALQASRVLVELAPDLRHPLVEDRDRLRPVGAGDDVLALGVEHDVAVQDRFAGRRVAREQDAGPGVDTAVAEDHRLHRHRRAEVVGDPLVLAVGAGPVAVPRAEDGLDRRPELGPRILRHVLDADDVAEHRDEALPAVGGECLAARRGRQPGGRRGGQPQVEDRVHHAGHRDRRAGPDADEERIRRVAERSADEPLDPRHVLAQLRVQAVRPAVGEVLVAGRRRDRERRRDRQAEVDRHHGEVGGLAPDEPLDLGEGQVVAMVAVVDVAHGADLLDAARHGRWVTPGAERPLLTARR